MSDTHIWNIQIEGAVNCEDLTTVEECFWHDCYWYDGSCHSNPQDGNGEIPWALIGVTAIIGIGIGLYIWKRKK